MTNPTPITQAILQFKELAEDNNLGESYRAGILSCVNRLQSILAAEQSFANDVWYSGYNYREDNIGNPDFETFMLTYKK
jgi:hypothetical protein